MQYLEGQTLADRSAAGALPLDQVFRYAIQIAGALDRAHSAGIVHRDLKPGNVMLTRSGATLLDFGLAKSGASIVVGGSATILPTTPPGLTLEGTILGTFQYMAPEQLEGREVDTRTDIFAFGALLYEMATGRKAFDGRTQASVMGAILKDTPPPMAGFEPAIPAALDRLVTRCLAKDTDRRWQTARDLEDELRWIAEGGHTSIDDMPTSHPSASSSTGRKRSRHRNDEPGGRTSLRS